MSFSAMWGSNETQHDVCKPDVTEDLALENAFLSPVLDQMADDVKTVVEQCAEAAAAIITDLPDSSSGQFTVSAYGHVRQSDNDSSTITLTINEKAAVVT